MSNIIADLSKKSLISPPNWLEDNVQYLCIIGSVAYGTSSDTSDMDIYGICIPKKDDVFPHLRGEILGFGRQHNRFEQYQQHGIQDDKALAGKGRTYDFTVFSIVKYFHLFMENNPNCIDAAFVPRECVLHSTQIGNLFRDNRKLFLHKGCWPKFKGYAYSQLAKMKGKNPTGKRVEIRNRYGFDCKFGSHVVRLLYEAEMILAEGDLDLRRHNEHLKAIRRGDVSEDEIINWASEKEKQLEQLYHESKLPWGPDEAKIKNLLLQCLEIHFGSLDKCIVRNDLATETIRDIEAILQQRHKGIFGE